MKHWMVILLLASMPAFAQKAPKPAPSVPVQLTTAERVALHSCESAKQELQKRWQEIVQQEQAILTEFSAEHPGHHLNPQSFAVEDDATKAAPAAPAKK
jgi:hypothetical protein